MQSDRTYSIYGDTSTSRATIVPSLNSIANKGTVEISKDTNYFKAWNKLVLTDNILEDKIQYQMPNTTSTSEDSTSSRVEFDFDLMGMTKMREIAIEFTVELKLGISPVAEKFQWSQFPQGEYMFLNMLSKLIITMGANSIDLSEQVSINPKLHAILRKKTPTQCGLLAQFGTSTASSTIIRGFGNDYSHPDIFSNTFNAMTPPLSIGGQTVLKTFTVLLGDVYPFFDQADTYLPKGMPLRIKATIDTKVPLNSVPELLSVNKVMPLSTQLVYRYSTLVEDTQKQFNQRWVGQSLLYDSYIYRMKTLQSTSLRFSDNILINMQRPLELTLLVTTTDDNTLIKDNFNNKDYYSFPNSAAGGIVWHDLKISMQGRELQLWQNRGQSGQFGSAYSWLNTLSNAETAHETSGDMGYLEMGNTNSDYPTPVKICLSPGAFYKRGVFPMDQGSINLTIEAQISRIDGTPLSLNYKLLCYTKTPSQVSIDSNFNVVEVQWPSLISDNKAFVQSTINTN